jgi:hypothetical protein
MKKVITIPERELAAAASLWVRLRVNDRREVEEERQETPGRGRETSASPSNKTRAERCEKSGKRSSSSLSAGEGAAAWTEGRGGEVTSRQGMRASSSLT